MSAIAFELEAAIQALGVARAFIGDAETANGLSAVPTQGEISVSAPQQLNRLTAPELTGDIAHDAWVTPGQVQVTVPVIYGGAVTMAMFSAHGSAGEGFNTPRRPTYTTLVLIPLLEMSNDDPPTISYDPAAEPPATPWTPAAPVNALWFWRTVPQRPDMRFAWEDGGRIILPVTFEVFFDATRPSGNKVFTHGDPVAKGITTIRI